MKNLMDHIIKVKTSEIMENMLLNILSNLLEN